ncbi:stress protein [Bacillus xiapuensis]|uniref:stress protein n=1 Tax=Bacillus xiapuensis TaxID=2014075 RepID=UPI000C24AD90|nr:stress protein [Bacillus xiapuensis]
MKKIIPFLSLLLILSLVACGNSSSTSKSESNEKVQKEEKVTVDTIITAFKDAGLEAENPTELENKEFGNTREAGKRILVPSLGEDAGGRIFEFKNASGLDAAKTYYDELGNSGPLFYSHTYSKGNFLLQMNGDMKDDQFEKYKKVMDEMIK